MPKPKKPPIPSKKVVQNYDSLDLLAAINGLEHGLGWEAFKEFVYYQAAVHRTMSNVLVQQTGKQYEACAAGAKAEVLLEVADKFIEQLKDKVQGKDGVLSNDRTEEDN